MTEPKRFPDPRIPVAIIRGSLFNEPEVKESAKGNPYVKGNVKMDGGGFMKLMVMDRDLMNVILELHEGSEIIAKGQVTVGVYNGNPSMTMFPTHIKVVESLDIGFDDAPKPRPKKEKKQEHDPTRDLPIADEKAKPPKDDLEDELPF